MKTLRNFLSGDQWVPKLMGLLGLVAFVVCILAALVPRITGPATTKECIAQPNPSTEQLNNNLGMLTMVVPYSDNLSLNESICVIVAGAAPSAAQERLNQKVKDAGSEAETKRADYDLARTAAANARRDTSAARATADKARETGTADPKADAELAKAVTTEAAANSLVQTLAAARDTADNTYEAAVSALSRGLPLVEITPFLDGHRAAQSTVKVTATAEPQPVLFSLGTPVDANNDVVAFWRTVLAGRTDYGLKKLRLGLARGASDSPEVQPKEISIRIFTPMSLIAGGVGTFLLALALALYARTTAMLRDNGDMGPPQEALGRAQKAYDVALAKKSSTAILQPPANKEAIQAADSELANAEADLEAAKTATPMPLGPYSLARTQMAFWLILTLAGFLFIWLTLGVYANVMTASILTLLGIQAVSGLTSIQIKPSIPQGGAPPPPGRSRSFVADLLNDGDSPQLQRVQVVLWTLVLGVVFLWSVVYSYTFAAFDTNLLLLMGISQLAYIGFKFNETPKPA